jgi:hypothetical protein
LNKTEDVAVDEITTESSNSYVKLEDNDNISQKINFETIEDNATVLKETAEEKPEVRDVTKSRKKFDVQEMLERFRKRNKNRRNETWENNYKLLSCKAQPFLQRISILGEFFK